MMRSDLNSIVSSKISESGMKVMSVPVCFADFTSAMTCSFCLVVPRSKDIAWIFPSRVTSTLNHSETALTHFAPTPCVPPEYS